MVFLSFIYQYMQAGVKKKYFKKLNPLHLSWFENFGCDYLAVFYLAMKSTITMVKIQTFLSQVSLLN